MKLTILELQNVFLIPKQSFPVTPSLQFLATTNLFSVSVVSPTLDCRNRIIQHVVLCVWLVSFNMFSRFSFHSFYGRIMSCCIDTPHFTYLFIHWWNLAVPPFGCCEHCCSEHSFTGIWVPVFNSFGCISKSGIAGHMVILCLSFWWTSHFQKMF